MPAGKIIKWIRDRGYGFIREDGDKGHYGDFVHINSMPNHEEPELGSRFEFDRVAGIDGRTKAINVRAVTTWGDAAYV